MKAENKMNVWLASHIANLKESIANQNCSKKDREIFQGQLSVYEGLFRDIAFEGRELNALSEEILSRGRDAKGKAKAYYSAYEQLQRVISDESKKLD